MREMKINVKEMPICRIGSLENLLQVDGGTTDLICRV